VPGLDSVVFVYKASLKMAAAFFHCIIVEQQTMIRFVVKSHLNIISL
jgi:hypothetical protein